MNGYWFTSPLFEVEPGEDEDINPGRYGRQLAVWLKKQLEGRGYSVEPIINEDWGRCLICSRDPFMLWVGCGNAADPQQFGHAHVEGALVWHCFAAAACYSNCGLAVELSAATAADWDGTLFSMRSLHRGVRW
jgi:hypothetical protein